MSSTNGRTFLDTNVLVYAVDASAGVKRTRAQAVLAEADPSHLVLSAQVLAEFYVVVTRKLATPLPERDAAAAVSELSRLKVVPLDADLIADAIALARKAHLSLWDGMVIRAAAEAGCERVLTEDLSDGRTIAGVRIENPFAS